MAPKTPSTPLAVRVAVPAPLRGAFDYLSPTAMLSPGVRVRVPFGRGTRIGIVLKTDVEPALPIAELKTITEVLDLCLIKRTLNHFDRVFNGADVDGRFGELF